jgi:hypothetical protein
VGIEIKMELPSEAAPIRKQTFFLIKTEIARSSLSENLDIRVI